jgi:hypothetical protein
LAEHDVEFIVVGMLAGVIQGAPLTTGDVDIVHRRTPENVQRLLEVLRRVNAVARHDQRRLVPGESHLMGSGHILLESTFGDLDCLCTIDDGKGYEDLLGSTVRIELGDGLATLALRLDALIEIKRRAGRPKDIAAIPVLESTWAELGRAPKT